MQKQKPTKNDVIQNIKTELRKQYRTKAKMSFIKTAFTFLGIFVAIVLVVGLVLRYFFPEVLTDVVVGIFLVCIGVSVISVVLILLISEPYADMAMRRLPAIESDEIHNYLKETIADAEKELAEVKEELDLLYETQEAYFPKEL